MKKIILLLAIAGFMLTATAQNNNVGIGTTTPDASAKLDVVSTSQGFLPPRMTSVQRDAINNPATGLTIYNTTDSCLQLNIGTPAAPNWQCLCTSCAIVDTDGDGVPDDTDTDPADPCVPAQAAGYTGYDPTNATWGGADCDGDGERNIEEYDCGSDPYNSASVCSTTVTCTNGEVTGINGAIWMCKNLGATQVATSSTDSAAYGDLYQWGRLTDGHEIRTSGLTNITATSAVPGHNNFITVPLGGPTDTNWTDFSGEDNLWQGLNGINNPCPAGWRVPTSTELKGEMEAQAAAGLTPFDGPLKMPYNGNRDYVAGSMVAEGAEADYWTSTISGTLSISMRFVSGISPSFSTAYRAHGLGVRCIKGAVTSTTDTDGDGVPDDTDTDPADPCVPVQAAGYTGYDGTNAIWRAANCDGDANTNGEEYDCGSDPYDNTSDCCPIVPSVTSTTGKIWMDRNLGASQVATSSTDTAAWGDLYQWGRAADGHQLRSSGTTTTIATTADPGHDDFIIDPANNADSWTTYSDQDNLWQGVNGINNPCPPCYRLPTSAEWEAELDTFQNYAAIGAFNSPLKLTLAGNRSNVNGFFEAEDDLGEYWSSTLKEERATYMFFDENGVDQGIYSAKRIVGFSVRCVKD